MSRDDSVELNPLEDAKEEIAAAQREMEIAVESMLTVAERLMARENASGETEGQSLEADYFAIFEACGFHDITGQRLSKALRKIDQASAIHEAIARHGTIQPEPGTGPGTVSPEEDELLNGPALPGAGLDQDAVNFLLKSGEGK